MTLLRYKISFSVCLLVASILLGACKTPTSQANLNPTFVPVTTLIFELQNTNGHEQIQVINRLGQHGPAASPAIPALLDVLVDPATSNDTQQAILRAFGMIGSPAQSAAGDIERILLTTDSEDTAISAVQSLQQIGSTSSGDNIALVIRTTDSYGVRSASTRALIDLGLASAYVADLLFVLETNNEEAIRKLAIDGIASTGSGGKCAVPQLMLVVIDEHNSTNLRQTAASAVSVITQQDFGTIAVQPREVEPEVIANAADWWNTIGPKLLSFRS